MLTDDSLFAQSWTNTLQLFAFKMGKNRDQAQSLADNLPWGQTMILRSHQHGFANTYYFHFDLIFWKNSLIVQIDEGGRIRDLFQNNQI